MVGAVCAILKRLGSPHAVGYLIEGLHSAESACRAVIHRTLVELTGRDLPASHAEWSAEFAPAAA